ncbi:MAG: hypothetical protein IJC35_04140 [Oscillospiraceae bacterium]|nr:hypothetical protein [Oscillospiraceae bacterium]
MNKKLLFRNAHGKTVFCVLSGEKDHNEQLCAVFGFEKGRGYAAELWQNEVRIVDYFHGDTVASFPVLSFEETDLPVSLTQNT